MMREIAFEIKVMSAGVLHFFVVNFFSLRKWRYQIQIRLISRPWLRVCMMCVLSYTKIMKGWKYRSQTAKWDK